MRRPRRWTRLALALGAAGVALAVAEVGVRVAGVDLNPDPCLRFDPALGWTLDPQCEGWTPIYEDGFRHRSRMERRPGVRRVVLLGDSFSVGSGFPYAETFPGLLESRLVAAAGGSGDPWEVVNLSAGDWGTAQQLVALRRHGLALDPEVVVIQVFPFNDVCNNAVELDGTCSHLDLHRPYFVTEGQRLEPTAVSPLRSRARSLSRLFGLAENRLGAGIRRESSELSPEQRKALRRADRDARRQRLGLRFSVPIYTLVPAAAQPAVIREAWDVTGALLTEIVRQCDDRGIPVVGLVIPFAEIFNPEWVDEQRAVAPELDPEHDTATVERILADRGAAIISMRELVATGEHPWRSYFFPKGLNDRHLSAAGHSRVTEWIFREVAALGLG